MEPAAVLSTLIKIEGMESATARLRQYDSLSRKASGGSDKFSKSTTEQGKAVRETNRHLNNGVKAIAGMVGAFGAYSIAKGAISDTLALSAATNKLSAITGLDTKEASSWIEVMKVRGVQTKQVNMAFITLSKNIRNAEDGSKTARKSFDQLGVSQEYLRTHSTQQVMLMAAEGMKNIESPARRAALAQQLFGRGGQALIPILNKGSKGIQDLLSTAQRYGAYLPNTKNKLADLREAQRNLNLAMDGMKISFTQAVLPSLVQGANLMLRFVGQMRSGQGAGGQFASIISRAFGMAKSVISTTVSAVGGLKNAMIILLSVFVASKVWAFANALKAMWALAASNPWGAALAAIGLLVTAFSLLSGHQRTVAQTARDVSNAWDQVRSSANALRDANLAQVQSQIDVARTARTVSDAQRAKKRAFDEFGAKSSQYKAADLDLRQANLDLVQAQNRAKDSIIDKRKANQADTDAVIKAIGVSKGAVQQDRDRIRTLNIQIAAMARQGGHLKEVHDLEGKASEATRQLARDQADLNNKINSMPKARLSTINLNVDFASNMAGAIEAIAKSIGGTPLTKKPSWAGHYSGGVVDTPGYFAGEEAPRHPEVILATNPAYRERNLGLFAQAGAMLGVPGFAKGGMNSQTGNMITGTPPWATKTASKWMKPKAAAWINKMADQLRQSLAGLGGGGGAAANAALWMQGGGPQAVAQIAGAIAMAESGGRDIVQQGQPYATTGWGRWQITPGNSVPSVAVDQGLLIPINNARAAVVKYQGAGGRFTPWTTYTSGKYQQFMGAAPGALGPISGAGGLQPQVLAAINYARKHGWTGSVTSGYRSYAQQLAIWNSGVRPAARPGTSMHERGLAIDVSNPSQFAAIMAGAPAGVRLYSGASYGDPIHFSTTGHRKGGIHGAAKRFAKGGISYEPKLQKKFANTTAYLKRMWKIAAPAYHRGSSSMPKITYTQGRDGLFVGVDAGMGKGFAPGHRDLFVPDWIVNGDPGAHGSKGLAQHDAAMLQLMLHEWSHEFQRNDMINKIQNKVDPKAKNVLIAEGGAQAKSIQMAPGVFSKLGIRGGIDRTSYAKDTRWVQKNLGGKWISDGQFGYAKGGIRGRIPRYATGGWHAGNRHISLSTGLGGVGSVGSMMPGGSGIPGLPKLPSSPSAPSQIQGRIIQLSDKVTALQQKYTNYDSFFSLSQGADLTDPTTGAINAGAVNARVGQLQQLENISREIFDTYNYIVAWTQRLIQANATAVRAAHGRLSGAQTILARLRNTLSHITTKGLKGAALKSAQKHQKDTQLAIDKYGKIETGAKADITKYSDAKNKAIDDLTNAQGSRFSSWIDYKRMLGEKLGVQGTKAVDMGGGGADTGGGTAADTGATDSQLATVQAALDAANYQNSITTAALLSARVQIAQNTVFSNFTGGGSSWASYLGSFAEGGLALVGERGPELAAFPSGTRIFSNKQSSTMAAPTIVVQVLDGAVNESHIRVLAGDEAKRALSSATPGLVNSVNRTIGNTVGSARQTPASPRRLATY